MLCPQRRCASCASVSYEQARSAGRPSRAWDRQQPNDASPSGAHPLPRFYGGPAPPPCPPWPPAPLQTQAGRRSPLGRPSRSPGVCSSGGQQSVMAGSAAASWSSLGQVKWQLGSLLVAWCAPAAGERPRTEVHRLCWVGTRPPRLAPCAPAAPPAQQRCHLGLQQSGRRAAEAQQCGGSGAGGSGGKAPVHDASTGRPDRPLATPQVPQSRTYKGSGTGRAPARSRTLPLDQQPLWTARRRFGRSCKRAAGVQCSPAHSNGRVLRSALQHPAPREPHTCAAHSLALLGLSIAAS